MNRDEKTAVIDEIAAQIEGADAIFAVDYRGITVTQAAELRGKLRESEATFRVVKNRLTKLAAERAGEERLAELLEGPTALAFVNGDTAQAAKAISTFSREHGVLAFKGGFMDSLSLDQESFKSISRLPSREVLNGQLAGMVASPLTGIVRGLGSMIQGLALQLGQIAEKGLVSGDAPAQPREEEDSAASSAGGAAGGTTPEEASATAGGGGSPAATGPADEGVGPSDEGASATGGDGGSPAATGPAADEAGEETSETDDKSKEEENGE